MDMFEYQKKLAGLSQQSLALWQKMAQTHVQIFGSLFDPWKPVLETLQKLGPAVVHNWSGQLSQAYARVMHQKNLGMFQEWDKKVLGQLQQMATANLLNSYQKLMNDATRLLDEAQGKDLSVLMDYWQGMLTEYLKDMELIAREIKKIDLQHVAEIFAKTMTGQWDENVHKYHQRFWDALKVKMQFGPEYYSQPDAVKVGQTPKQVVWSKGKWQLYHYAPEAGKAQNKPVLIVYALINRPYIEDLTPGVSLVQHFLGKGLDVYLGDWGEPAYEDRHITLDQFIEDGIGGMVECVCNRHAISQVPLFGHCMGGVLSVIYTALHQDRVASLTTLTAPMTAQKGGVVSAWTYLAPVDLIVDTFGNVPAKLIRYTFISMKPYYEAIRWLRYYATLDKADAKAMEVANAVDKWVNDNVDIPGEFFRKFMTELFVKEGLVNGTMTINNRRVSLADIRCPVLNIFGEEDWIVTPQSAMLLNDLVSSTDKTARQIAGQHLGILFDPRNRPVWDEMAQFFARSCDTQSANTSPHVEAAPSRKEAGAATIQQPSIKGNRMHKKTRPLSRGVAIVGAGVSQFGAFPEKSSRDLFVEAFQEMVSSVDKGFDQELVDALYIGNFSSDLFEGQSHLAPLLTDAVGLTPRPAVRVEDACASGGVAMRQAVLAIASGMCDVVVVGGVEKMTNLPIAQVTDTLGVAADTLYEVPVGFTFPALYAAIATAYMDRYGATPDDLMHVALKNHDNGALNPKAQFNTTILDFMQGKIEAAKKKGRPLPTWKDAWEFLHDNGGNPMIAWPLRLFDCSPVTDGAGCLLLVAADLAASFSDKPIHIVGCGQASDAALHARADLTTLPAAVEASRIAYEMAGITAADIRVAEVHDCFTIAEVVASEDLGLFPRGQGYRMAKEGVTARGGKMPINTSGGLKAKGHPVGASGVAQVYELWKQMRGEAGNRQLSGDIPFALAHNVGATGSTCVVHILARK